MAGLPIAGASGNVLASSQNDSLSALRRFTRIAAESSTKINTGERITNPGEDILSFLTSRQIRSELSGLQAVQQSGQVNITGLGLAIDGLGEIKNQLDSIKSTIVGAQVASEGELEDLQATIDLALKQIDSTARNTKLGSRSLLNGDSTVQALRVISVNGTVRTFSIDSGLSAAGATGINAVTVNKIGVGGAVKALNDGRNVVSIRVSIASANAAAKAWVQLAGGTQNTGEFVEYRVTGKLGSATIRLTSNFDAGLADTNGAVDAFNRLALETGVVLTSGTSGNGGFGFTSVGYGADEFVKVELIASSEGNAATTAAVGANTITGTEALGTSVTAYGRAAVASINGKAVTLGGEFGTTARYQDNGYDISIDFSTNSLSGGAANEGTEAGLTTGFTSTINIDLSQGLVGLVGTSGQSGDLLQYSIGNFTTEALGRGAVLNTVTAVSTASGGGTLIGADNEALGNQVINQYSVAELGSGGRADLTSGNLQESLRTVDRALNQVIKEQVRLGNLQGAFAESVARAQVQVGNLAAAEADIIGVDTATEVTNLVSAQLGISTASALLGQGNNIQSQILGLLR